jgi:hypothetical protein
LTHEFEGAASQVATEATAFGLRRDHVLVQILAAFTDSGDKVEEERYRQWARATRGAFGKTALPGGYPSLLVADNAERVSKSYGPMPSEASPRSGAMIPITSSGRLCCCQSAGDDRYLKFSWSRA